MKAYQDKSTGLWKWGTRGEAIHDSKAIAERFGMDSLTDKLRRLREKLKGVCSNSGR
jgi:hypothetical protein